MEVVPLDDHNVELFLDLFGPLRKPEIFSYSGPFLDSLLKVPFKEHLSGSSLELLGLGLHDKRRRLLIIMDIKFALLR